MKAWTRSPHTARRVQAAVEANSIRLLDDKRALRYALDGFDTFKLAETITISVPVPARVALICAPENLPDATYWETVAVTRGPTVRIRAAIEPALAWLKSERAPRRLDLACIRAGQPPRR